MATLCIGGVCIPYSAIIPLVLLAFKWLMDKIFKAFGIEWPHQKSAAAVDAASSCCSSTEQQKNNSSARSMPNGNGNDAVDHNHDEVKKMTTQEDWDQLLLQNEWVMVKFTAQWCKPCHAIQPCYEQLAQQYTNNNKRKDSIAFVVVDVDELEDVASLYQVAMMPTFVLIHRQNVVVGKMTGSSETQLQSFVEKHLSSLIN